MTEQEKIRRYLGRVPIETNCRFRELLRLSDRDVDKIIRHICPTLLENDEGFIYYGHN